MVCMLNLKGETIFACIITKLTISFVIMHMVILLLSNSTIHSSSYKYTNAACKFLGVLCVLIMNINSFSYNHYVCIIGNG